MPSALCPHRALLRPPPPTFAIVASLLVHRPHPHHHNFRLSLSHAYSSHSSKSHTRPSSSTQPSTTSSTSTTSTSSLAHDINPPPSTRPADLNLPATLPKDAPPASKLKRYIAVGRAYLTFYKTGLKNVYHNYRAALPLRRSLGLPVYLPSSPPPAARHAAAFRKSLLSSDLSRSQFQLLRRSAYDVRRMIPFALILIVCGEMTPLAVLALGNAVTPLTCRVPRQLEKERIKRSVRKRDALVPVGSVTAPTVGSDAEMSALRRMADPEWIRDADDHAVLRACAALGLAKTHTRPTWWVGLIYRPRLNRYAEYLDLDDGLIRSCGGVSRMEASEVRMAVEERGRVGVGLTGGEDGWEVEREERRWLEKWLAARERK
ncbi:hypothetical protein BO70DRAFT_366291 [Aspergillus heteromorphus CBS 117.55]|uniref:Letm1 RBD domain-containing protein n=1 Tax=Aspergillus heteromorphus CBS 117.55 TaxID=1448321 RepID=A0A317UZS6_9EURO|nr:uncharacterized protein BO70DRAFT_366291 [Aspergillus heteromorphus CBS 117.55]PWY67554.1 hypothetical protein BO70DRAFT_366291 [Aspergillus heteromorphus CBS 117.55]